MGKFFLRVLTVLIAMISLFVLSACDKDKKAEKEKYSGFGFLEKELYISEGREMFVEVSVIASETPFLADGKAGELKEFMEITIYGSRASADAKFRFKSDPETICGVLKPSLRRGDMTATFESEVKLSGGTVIEIEVDGAFEEYVLEDAMFGAVGYEAAVEAAKNEFDTRINSETTEKGEFNREMYFRIARDPYMRGAYYYFISFIGSEGDFWSALINPSNGEVISSN